MVLTFNTTAQMNFNAAHNPYEGRRFACRVTQHAVFPTPQGDTCQTAK